MPTSLLFTISKIANGFIVVYKGNQYSFTTVNAVVSFLKTQPEFV